LKMREYLWEAHGAPLLLSLPLALFLWAIDGWLRPADYKTLFEEVALGGLFYGAEILLLYHRDRLMDSLSVFWAKPSGRPVPR